MSNDLGHLLIGNHKLIQNPRFGKRGGIHCWLTRRMADEKLSRQCPCCAGCLHVKYFADEWQDYERERERETGRAGEGGRCSCKIMMIRLKRTLTLAKKCFERGLFEMFRHALLVWFRVLWPNQRTLVPSSFDCVQLCKILSNFVPRCQGNTSLLKGGSSAPRQICSLFRVFSGQRVKLLHRCIIGTKPGENNAGIY